MKKSISWFSFEAPFSSSKSPYFSERYTFWISGIFFLAASSRKLSGEKAKFKLSRPFICFSKLSEDGSLVLVDM